MNDFGVYGFLGEEINNIKVVNKELFEMQYKMNEELNRYYMEKSLQLKINYNDKIIRVTPLEYNGVIKYFTNRKEGVKCANTCEIKYCNMEYVDSRPFSSR